jgi:predicted MFS family arabinose efflux permease
MQSTSSRDIGTAVKIWTPNLVMLATTTFLLSFGTGLNSGVSTNFFKEIIKMNSGQQMALAGVREIPGLLLMFIAALSMHLPLTWRAAVSVVIMGIGYALYAVVNSYVALVAVALVGSLGFHSWMPLTSSLALGLTTKAHSGKVLGSLASIGALASITALLVSFVFSNFVPRDHFPLRTFLAAGGISMIIAGLLIVRLPKHIGRTVKEQPRLLFRRRYWLYYVLTFFEGSRTQVFGAFNLLVLVQYYHWDVYHITALLAASGLVNFLLARRLGHLLDHIGERLTLAVSYVLLSLCFVGYALAQNPLLLGVFLICINLLVTLSMGLSTYVNRIAPPEELTPTLSTGVSINHITSVSMSLLAGYLLNKGVPYALLCWGAATIIIISVPFALAIRIKPVPVLQPSPVAAE